MVKIESVEQFIKNAEEYKEEITTLYALFYFDEVRKWKDNIYSMPCKKGKNYTKDIMWEYIWNDLEYWEMKEILLRSIQ